MHKPSGLGVYGLWQTEEVDGSAFAPFKSNFRTGIDDTEVWYVKPFWRKAWSPIGATVLYGEFGQYNDQFGGLAGQDLCFGFVGGSISLRGRCGSRLVRGEPCGRSRQCAQAKQRRSNRKLLHGSARLQSLAEKNLRRY